MLTYMAVYRYEPVNINMFIFVPEYVTDNFVLVTDVAESGIYQIDIDSNQILGLPIESTSNQRIEAAVYDPVENQVIWIDTGNGTLRSLVLEDGCTEKIIYTFTDGNQWKYLLIQS